MTEPEQILFRTDDPRVALPFVIQHALPGVRLDGKIKTPTGRLVPLPMFFRAATEAEARAAASAWWAEEIAKAARAKEAVAKRRKDAA